MGEGRARQAHLGWCRPGSFSSQCDCYVFSSFYFDVPRSRVCELGLTCGFLSYSKCGVLAVRMPSKDGVVYETFEKKVHQIGLNARAHY